ncbi:MAG: metallopeptidase family protein [Candidatus Kerfeldbacteria bacterium]|nr:metallopeptidase family protein [Candidatus Kerfeldbacteria bacterium]
MDNDQFEKYIHEAIARVPAAVRERIENVAFVIENEPRAARATERSIKARGTLLGLYQGVPLPKRSAYYSGVLPDKITIFKQAIEHVAGPDVEHIRQTVHEVVHHEIAHYLGMDERAVRAWEQKRKIKNTRRTNLS